MAENKIQIQQNTKDWIVTFAALALIVLICIGYYIHTHPNIESSPEKSEQVLDYTL